MDRETWQASPWDHKRVGHNFATKQQYVLINIKITKCLLR